MSDATQTNPIKSQQGVFGNPHREKRILDKRWANRPEWWLNVDYTESLDINDLKATPRTGRA